MSDTNEMRTVDPRGECRRNWHRHTRHGVVARLSKVLFCSALAVCTGLANVFGDEPVSFDILSVQFEQEVRPLLKQFCLECHSTQQQKGDLDLERFATLAEVRRGTKVWLKVVEMLDNGEMPPEDSDEPTPEQRTKLRGWAQRYLHSEALAQAGDPGPVVLRRLNNAEYTYTVRDLTGVDLKPAHEFPADGAAGEGFTNTGNALAMSPALLQKYFDAGKRIAGHAVLLPDGFRFSTHATRRDWTDEMLAQIRGFYRQFVDSADLGVGSAVGNINVHGDTRIGLAGRLPLESYFAATLAARDALRTGTTTIEAVARQRGVNARYLRTLWSTLSGPDSSLLLDDLRSRWRNAKPEDAAALAADVATWQKGLWTFRPVGLIGRQGGPSRWMEPVNPLVTQHDIRFAIPALNEGEEQKEVVLSLVATDAGDGNEHDFIVWQEPRLVVEGQPDMLLRDVMVQLDGEASKPAARPQPTSPHTTSVALQASMFGNHPNGSQIDAASLCVRAPSVIEVRLPADLAAGRVLVTTAVLDQETDAGGSVQPEVVTGTPTAASGIVPSQAVVTYSQVTQLYADHRELAFLRPFLIGKDSAARRRIESAFDEYRNLFPAALCYTQIVPVDEVLTLMLFYREDDHLARLMLDDAQRARLDRLWKELHFVSQSAMMRVTALDLLLEVLVNNHDAQHDAIEPLREPFQERAAEFRRELIDAEPAQLEALVDFTARAFRRPLTDAEADDLRGLYQRLREQALPHDEAFRLTLARVFMAWPFLYRPEYAPAGTAAAAVSDAELASRLSYFLWSSMPDEELRASADAGRLLGGRGRGRTGVEDEENLGGDDEQSEDHAELLRQTRRMLKDARVRRLAIEFACQYLHIHEFDSLDEKSEEQFPEFADLRGDMYEESILFFTDLFQNDGPLLSLLDADHSFVNERLANFYEIPWESIKQTSSAVAADGAGSVPAKLSGTEWRRQQGMRQHGRGGILGLAATLAKQSGASRTSPILRGNWVSEVLLGEKLPRPPRDVPQLATTVPEGLTERQLIERHSSDAACAKCHARIDPFGFALEKFDAIGRRREKSASGLVIDARTTLPDGTQIEGFCGLRDYLLGTRRDQFLRRFCRKLLGYALGREAQLSDEPLLSDMMERLASNGCRFSVAVETIVLSDQFRMKRGGEE